ncbi:ribosomal protection-like ABC-F family protein [Parapedobacter koreensis]|uniref:ATPase components of ABC transporters with duplicated ATPase domains n=1 Tax=Parapedobacter koreensis TaxID=332977 RepID=A0A1H7RDY0_9SPHI|nr:ABC-F family ATP-binding cassette domain-containing protein [Parapedobacter koreensis]SEL58279.1 ATPase components of ABC transporters with duplicated ATPase domains [Parapedobacter koreensis]
MLILQHLSYIHPNKDLLFDNINLYVNNHDKVALIGNNGFGKSTLLKIIAGELQPAGGRLSLDTEPYYVPQVFGQYNQMTVAQALRVADKLGALQEILNGNATEENMELLDDDWTVGERCDEALAYWQLTGVDLAQKMETLSGGQKTRVFLAGIIVHRPTLILLDEPSNHLDRAGRQLLYHFIRTTSSTLLIVSHDRKLLSLLDTVCELGKQGITVYGGNYDFYAEQKEHASNALSQDIRSKEKALRKAKEKERETLERQQKLDARGKQKQEKAGVARIMMNTLRNSAEKSTSKIKGVHAERIGSITQELHELRSGLPDLDKMRFGFDNTSLHKGKVLCSAVAINYHYGHQWLWQENLSFQLTSGERIALNGPNGSGKTTLIKLILGELEPAIGSISRATGRTVYIDQDYSLIDNRSRVYELAQRFNATALQEHEIKIRLNRFLFPKADWDKPCGALSGGEKMRLMLCCLTIGNQSPDIIVLDEPTNNLDIQNIEILTAAINEYEGTVIVVSHDDHFLQQIRVERMISLD